MLYTAGSLPASATNHLSSFNSSLVLHTTKSYTYMEQSMSLKALCVTVVP